MDEPTQPMSFQLPSSTDVRFEFNPKVCMLTISALVQMGLGHSWMRLSLTHTQVKELSELLDQVRADIEREVSKKESLN